MHEHNNIFDVDAVFKGLSSSFLFFFWFLILLVSWGDWIDGTTTTNKRKIMRIYKSGCFFLCVVRIRCEFQWCGMVCVCVIKMENNCGHVLFVLFLKCRKCWTGYWYKSVFFFFVLSTKRNEIGCYNKGEIHKGLTVSLN